ncbi:baseplate J/gp47 family protein [Actinomadura fibrosa]|uniref:Baseplate J/gp47 family protein n=1 Tax=Actinomadura fibrosa TaxID=111802 RepID=A0ABW2XVN7_9ACTN|nr:baseplate J/gp47 family protein [Actinomadura fibrosa]
MTFESRRGRIVPPNLDDRTWQDLVDQMRALIPVYAPQWTDHNPSDLGITLIELFAWLAESMIYRLNQVPDKTYVAFLDLLGITRRPAVPAHAYLTFTAGAGAVVVPAGTQAQTGGDRPVVFETDADARVLPTALKAAVLVSGGAYDDVTSALSGKTAIQVPAAQTAQLCLGFDRATSEELAPEVRLYSGAPPGLAVTFVHSAGDADPLAWPVLTGASDETDAFTHDGAFRCTPPAGWSAQQPTGPAPGSAADHPWETVPPRAPGGAVTDTLFWIGLRIANGGGGPALIGLERLLFNAAPARTAVTVRVPEELGVSTGAPFQVFALAQRPLARRPSFDAPYGDLAIQVGTGSPPVWQDWTLADDLPSGPGTVYRADPVTGEIGFGSYDPHTAPGLEGHGSIPPAGSRIRALRYRYVSGGQDGNVPPGQVTVLGTTLAGAVPAGVSAVTNLGPGQDGVDEEPVEDTLARAPQELKIRDRAVTADDYEFLVREASGPIVVRCLPPRRHDDDGTPYDYGGIVRAPGTVNLVIAPDQGPSVARPVPSPGDVDEVRAHLEPRRELTAQLVVHGPCYLPVIVTVEVTLWQRATSAGADRDQVRADTLARIQRFLHPTRGGPDGTGWQVGQPVFASDLFQAIAPTQDLGYLSKLLVRPDAPAYTPPARPFPLSQDGASVRVADYELVCASATQTITMVDARV